MWERQFISEPPANLISSGGTYDDLRRGLVSIFMSNVI